MPSLLFESRRLWYSPYINHFLSADTIVPSYTNPQSFNRFAYVLNNPLRYTDPTGHKETECGHQSDSLCAGSNGGATGNTSPLKKEPKQRKDRELLSRTLQIEEKMLQAWQEAIEAWPRVYQEQLDKYEDLFKSTSVQHKPWLKELYNVEVNFWTVMINDDGTISSWKVMNAARAQLKQAMFRARINGEIPGCNSGGCAWDQYDSSSDYLK